MSEGSIRHREAFIANIARRLGRSAPLTVPPNDYPRGIPEHVKNTVLSSEEKIDLFRTNWTALTGQVWLVPENKAHELIPAILSEIVAELDIERIAIWDHDELAALGLHERMRGQKASFVPWVDMKTAADDADSAASGSNWARRSPLLKATEQCQLGIVWPDFAVANTGSLILRGGPGRGRSVSLLPGSLFGIFREEQLVARLGQAFAGISEEADNEMPSSYTVITGPSRSADIENDLTIGIHGPGKVFAVIIVAGQAEEGGNADEAAQ